MPARQKAKQQAKRPSIPKPPRDIPQPVPKTGRKGKQMTDVEKGMIIALCWVYGVYATVSKIVGRPWSTVKSFLERHYIRGTTSNRKRSGRPEKLTKRQKRQILRAVKNDRRCTREEIRKLFCPNVTHSTLDRLLQKHNIRKWLAKKRPLLTGEHARKRL